MPRHDADQSLAARVHKQRSFYKPEVDPSRLTRQQTVYNSSTMSSTSTSTTTDRSRHRSHHHHHHPHVHPHAHTHEHGHPRPRGRPPIQYDDALPRSVRHAPTELRAIIRRRQNNESAKRCRERERAHMEAIEQKYEENQRRIADLEAAVDELSTELGGKGGSSGHHHRMM